MSVKYPVKVCQCCGLIIKKGNLFVSVSVGRINDTGNPCRTETSYFHVGCDIAIPDTEDNKYTEAD